MTVSKMMNFKKGSIQNMAMLSGVGDDSGIEKAVWVLCCQPVP